MTEQNFNPQASLKSCLALSDAVDRFLTYLEKNFSCSEEEATWLLANLLFNYPALIDKNPEMKDKFIMPMAQQVKERCNQLMSNTNDQN